MINKLKDNYVVLDENNSIIFYGNKKDEALAEIENHVTIKNEYNMRIYKFYDTVLRDEIMEYFNN